MAEVDFLAAMTGEKMSKSRLAPRPTQLTTSKVPGKDGLADAVHFLWNISTRSQHEAQ